MNTNNRRAIVAGNWKMNMLPSQVTPFAERLTELVRGVDGVDMLICAPSVLLPVAVSAFSGSAVSIGAQNMSEHSFGAYTGEVSGAQLHAAGARYVIVGHSERRAMYGETDELTGKKALAALTCGLIPIICVGETGSEHDTGMTDAVVKRQLDAALSGIDRSDIGGIIIAYEPVWAIGTGKTATARYADGVCSSIRKHIDDVYGHDAAAAAPVLYGGSVNAKNAGELFSMPAIDGGLVGGASLSPDEFALIIEAAATEVTHE